MELKEFVRESLAQILEGVAEAKRTHPKNIVPSQTEYIVGSNLVWSRDGMIVRVDFDVSVTTEMSASGGAKINVLNVVSVSGDGGGKSASANRLTFAVPVLLGSENN